MHKVSLLQNCIPILLLSKSNTNLKFRARTATAWSYMKLRLFHNPRLLWYKVVKTWRRIQQWYSSWNMFVYIFTLSVCKIAHFQAKKKQKKDSQMAYVLILHLKLQHRISRSNSCSRYLENANSQNIFIWRHLYGFAEAVVQRCSTKKIFSKFCQNLQENTCAKVIFSQVTAETCRLQHSFPMNLRDFLEHQFCIRYDDHMLYKIGVILKNLAIFTAKFMWTAAASAITENVTCLPGCKFSDVLQKWL